MALPDPVPGMVIRYAYLWSAERQVGREEGTKARPCVIIVAVKREGEHTVVTVAPITHRPPPPEGAAVEIPADQKRRLRLDYGPSWVVTDMTWRPSIRQSRHGSPMDLFRATSITKSETQSLFKVAQGG